MVSKHYWSGIQSSSDPSKIYLSLLHWDAVCTLFELEEALVSCK